MARSGASRLSLLESLRVPAYRRLFFSVTSANSGRWALLMGIGWLLQLRTHSPFWVGAGVFMVQAPIIVITPLAGVYADRYDRARMLATSFIAAAVTCLLLALTAFYAVSLPVVLGTALVFGVAYSFQSTNWNALTPNLVPPPMLGNAIALLTFARQGAEFLGPLLAGPLLAFYGPAPVLVLCGVFYGVAALIAFRIPRVAIQGSGASTVRVWKALGDGLVYVRERPVVLVLMILVGLHCVLTMAYMGLLPTYTTVNLKGGSSLYGLLMTVTGLGAGLGTLILAGLRHVDRRPLLFIGVTVVSGLSLLGLGASEVPALALASVVLMGLSQASFMTLLQIYIQTRVGDAYRGRVLSLFSVVTLGTMAIGNWLWGAAGQVIGAGWVMIGLGGGFTAVALLMLWISPHLKQAYLGVKVREHPLTASAGVT